MISAEFCNLPSNTESCCWWCTEPFDTVSISLPVNQNHISKKYIHHGIFCSWNCSKAFSFNQKDYKVGVRNDYINSIVRSIYGKFIHVDPALPRYRLTKFGGDLTIQQFRNFQYLDKNSRDIVKVTPLTLGCIKFS